MTMSAIEAVRFYVHDTTAPYTFTDAQIQEFLDQEKVVDANGYLPGEDDYIPTYDVMRAAGRAFLWLANRAGNTAAYRLGDMSVENDVKHYRQRAFELLGAASATLLRRDEIFEERPLGRYRED